MRYRRIKVRDFRGIDEREVEIGDGLTVLVGPNEVGKSSLLEAVNLLRTFKDSSKAAAIRNVRPVGRDASPFVELELETGPYQIKYRKQWWRAPRTELEVKDQVGRVQHFTGDEAHQKYLDLLKETVDLDLLDQVSVLQGESLQQAKLADVTALQHALGETPSDGDGDVLMDRVEQEYRRYYTPSGRDAKPLTQGEAELQNLREDLARAESRAVEATRFTEEFAANERTLHHLDEKLENDRVELESIQSEEAEVASLQEQLEQAQIRLEQVKEVREQLLAEVDVREQLRIEIEATRKAQEQKETELHGRALRIEAYEQDYQLIKDQVQQVQVSLADLRTRIRTYQRRLSERRNREDLESTAGLIARVTAAEDAMRKSQQTVASARVTDSILETLVEGKQRRDLAEAAWKTAAPRVKVTRKGPKSVTMRGRDAGGETVQAVGLDETISTEVFGTLRVEIAQMAELEIDAGASPEQLEDELRSAQSTFARLLEDAGVKTLSEAREQNAKYQRSRADLVRNQDILDELLAGTSLEQLRSREAELRGRLQGQEELPDREEDREAMEIKMRADFEQEEELEKKIRQLKKQVNLADSRIQESRQKLRSIENELDEVKTKSLALRYQLEAAVKQQDDRVLALKVEENGLHLEQVLAQVEELRTRIDPYEAERLQLVGENLRQAVQTTQERIQDLRNRNVELLALLNDRSEEGLFDQIQDLQAAVEHAETNLARLQQRAQAARLLRDTLVEYKRKAQQKYVEPFEAEINRLGRVLFGPDFAVHVDEELQIKSRTIGGTSLDFAHLSMGAKEQLSLLGRLACATLIDREAGAPVVMDDVLGYSDPSRLSDLNLVLNSVGKDAQVIVMTCQGTRFEGIGGARFIEL